MEHTGQQADLPLWKVMKQRCKLVIRFRTKLAKARCGTRRGSLIGGVRSGKGATGSRCRS
jgi:hypothetical protein